MRTTRQRSGESCYDGAVTNIRLNGTDREFRTHPQAALLWALRDEVGDLPPDVQVLRRLIEQEKLWILGQRQSNLHPRHRDLPRRCKGRPPTMQRL